MVGGGVHWRGRAPLPGVVEAVLPARGPGHRAVEAQDHGAADETETGADPAGVQGEAERHQALVVMGADGEPDGGDDAAQSWTSRRRGTKRRFEVMFELSDGLEFSVMCACPSGRLSLRMSTGTTCLIPQEAGESVSTTDPDPPSTPPPSCISSETPESCAASALVLLKAAKPSKHLFKVF